MIRTQTRRDGTVRVTFALPASTPPASVVGDFNEWDPMANPMRKRSNGTRSATIEVSSGTDVRFRYLLDGDEWANEPEAELVVNEHGTTDCIIRV